MAKVFAGRPAGPTASFAVGCAFGAGIPASWSENCTVPDGRVAADELRVCQHRHRNPYPRPATRCGSSRSGRYPRRLVRVNSPRSSSVVRLLNSSCLARMRARFRISAVDSSVPGGHEASAV